MAVAPLRLPGISRIIDCFTWLMGFFVFLIAVANDTWLSLMSCFTRRPRQTPRWYSSVPQHDDLETGVSDVRTVEPNGLSDDLEDSSDEDGIDERDIVELNLIDFDSGINGE